MEQIKARGRLTQQTEKRWMFRIIPPDRRQHPEVRGHHLVRGKVTILVLLDFKMLSSLGRSPEGSDLKMHLLTSGKMFDFVMFWFQSSSENTFRSHPAFLFVFLSEQK